MPKLITGIKAAVINISLAVQLEIYNVTVPL